MTTQQMTDEGWTEVTNKKTKNPKGERQTTKYRNYRHLNQSLRLQREIESEFEDTFVDPTLEPPCKLPIQKMGVFRNYQDHREVIVRKKKTPTTRVQRRPTGHGQGQGGHHQPGQSVTREVGEARRLAKIAEQTDPQKHQKVKKNLSQKMTQYRQKHKLSQAQLAQQVNVKEEIVKRMEKGEALHDAQLSQKFERFFHRQELNEKKPTTTH